MTPTTEVYLALRALFANASYPAVAYDPNTLVRTTSGSAVPASLELNELNSTFAQSVNRRGDKLDHTTWLWSVQISFNQTVDFSDIRKMLQSVPKINQARAILRTARYTHPPRQEANTGSRAEFVLNVLTHPL